MVQKKVTVLNMEKENNGVLLKVHLVIIDIMRQKDILYFI